MILDAVPFRNCCLPRLHLFYCLPPLQSVSEPLVTLLSYVGRVVPPPTFPLSTMGAPFVWGTPFVTIPSVVPLLDVTLQCLAGTFHLSILEEVVLGAGGPWCLCGLSSMLPFPVALARHVIIVCFANVGSQCPFPTRVVPLPPTLAVISCQLVEPCLLLPLPFWVCLGCLAPSSSHKVVGLAPIDPPAFPVLPVCAGGFCLLYELGLR